jgi:hypothetical protein
VCIIYQRCGESFYLKLHWSINQFCYDDDVFLVVITPFYFGWVIVVWTTHLYTHSSRSFGSNRRRIWVSISWVVSLYLSFMVDTTTNVGQSPICYMKDKIPIVFTPMVIPPTVLFNLFLTLSLFFVFGFLSNGFIFWGSL